jgi:adenylate cyclase
MMSARITRRELRLGSGLVMFSYVVVHFVDHALGLWSLAMAERALGWSVAVWHSVPGSLLLYGAAAVHIALALLAVYERRTLRMPAAQVVRLVLGFGMPVLLIGHVAATRMAADLYALSPTYTRIVWALWVSDGEGRQLAMQAPGWIHGCLGLHFAFGHRALWQRVRPALFGAALLMPVLAGLGFLAMGRELAALAADPAWLGAAHAAEPVQRIAIGRLRDGMLFGYLALIGTVFAARELRAWVEAQRRQLVSIVYPQRTVRVPRGWSVLEASRSFGIAHLSMCGGQARCSTCRVRVLEGAAELPPPSAQEQRTLNRIHAGDDVRLACQLRPVAQVRLAPLLDPHTAQAYERHQGAAIIEREVAVLFVKLTAWTSATNALHSPQDIVFGLNRFHDVVGDAVAAAGGLHGRYDNEGASATFGAACDRATALRQALAAAAAIERGLDALNLQLEPEVGFVARFTLALHCGPAAVVPVGYGPDRRPLPVGDMLRVARALREHGAAHGARFAISRPAAAAVGWTTDKMAWDSLVLSNPKDVLELALLTHVAAAY